MAHDTGGVMMMMVLEEVAVFVQFDVEESICVTQTYTTTTPYDETYTITTYHDDHHVVYVLMMCTDGYTHTSLAYGQRERDLQIRTRCCVNLS